MKTYFHLVIENYHSPERFLIASGFESHPEVVKRLASQAKFDNDLEMEADILAGNLSKHLGTAAYERPDAPQGAIFVKFRRNGHIWYFINESGDIVYE